MKTTREVLLTIGLLGIVASIFNLVQGDSFFDMLLGLGASASLVYGYFYFVIVKKRKRNET